MASMGAALVTPLSAQASTPLRLGVIGVGGRGTYHVGLALGFQGVEVTAVCDIDSARVERAAVLVEKAGRSKPATFSSGPKDYRRLLALDTVDAVIIATPVPLHASMAIDALRAHKHTLSEVGAAVTLQECWDLVRASGNSGRIYMLAENVCYYRQNLMIRQMIKAGVFGDMTFAECGYVHDCRALLFNPDGSLRWWGEMARHHVGNLYPTHALGPVAQWLGINRGDRMVSLVAFTSAQKGTARYAKNKFGADNPAANIKFAAGDTTTTLIRTARGAVIDLRYDMISARPHPSTTYFSLQGETASYKDDGTRQEIWVDGKSKSYAWQPLTDFAESYEHPFWKNPTDQARKSGHGGADYFVMAEFLEAIRTGKSPIDACDAAAWSSITPLSAASIRAGGAPQEIPDFTRGAWART